MALGAAILLAAACDSPAAPPATPRGLDATGFGALVEEARGGAMGDIRSLLLQVGQDAPVERYFRGARRDETAPVYSITKSITSLLAGEALSDAAIASVQAPLLDLLPRRAPLLAGDPRRSRLRLRDLLTMQTGIEWDELSVPYETPGNAVTQMLASNDWVGHVLSRPMAREPGTKYSYNSGASVVLGAAIAAATARPLAEYAQVRLFDPMGIARAPWHHGPRGEANAGGGLSMRPLDLLAVGRMVRDGGRHGDRDVSNAAWIAESWEPAAPAPLGARYGYQWWLLGPDGAWDASHPVAAALGWGGQLLMICRAHDLVAVVTARNFDRDALVTAQEWTRRLHAIAIPSDGAGGRG